MKMLRGQLLFFLLCLCGLEVGYAQSVISIRGAVADSSRTGIPGANVRLIAGRDTLISSTDSLGHFSFTGLRKGNISLLIWSIGYRSFAKDYTATELSGEKAIPMIILEPISRQLAEVVIKAKIIPMRLMKDTVEFNANAYTVRENDQVDDLLKQLPGVEIDKDGNVTSAGKALTKLRVNGKDFFTGDVKEFISRLPAGIVDKLQVIDDYGDKANFTGIKRGEPQKMLNLVLKDKANRGTFGNIMGSAGTNHRYSAGLNGNVWRDTRQIGLSGTTNNLTNGMGISTSSNFGLNYRDKLGKKAVISGTYTYWGSKTELSQQSHIQTVNTFGTIENERATNSSNHNKSHIFGLSLQSTDKDNYMNGNIRGSIGDASSSGIVSAMQTGVIHQDLINGSKGYTRSPNLNGDFTIGRKFSKPGRILSLGLTAGTTLSSNVQDQRNQIRFYDSETSLPVKDSLRIQALDTRNRNNNINATLTFSEPVGDPKDSLLSRSIDFSYVYTLTHTSNGLVTNVDNTLGMLKLVDSLSNKYTSSFITHTLGVNYRHVTKKVNYAAGINVQPNQLVGAYEGRNDRISRTGFNLSPVAQVSYNPSLKNSFSLFYNGNSVLPDFTQLQPVPDTRNLQNVIIGNPQLKAAYNHSLNLSYNRVNAVDGSTLQLTLRGTEVQNQVVSNTILIRDTLNGLKQETRFLNTSGYYNFGCNYYWSLPLARKKYTLAVSGSVSYAHQVAFSDNLENLSKGLNLHQMISIGMNRKWLMLNSIVGWNYRSNVYSLATSNANKVQTWSFTFDGRTFILKSLTAGMNGSKVVNQGFSLPGSNPLLLAGFVEKKFFDNRRAGIKLEVNDLLNQGSNISRSVSGNSITESRNNQVTRYFLLTLTWRLQHFPGMTGTPAKRGH